jgi:DNA polymerase-3 subunit delta'
MLATRLLDLDENKLSSSGQMLRFGESDESIGIDQVRQIQHFLSLKPALAGKASINRVIIIENAQAMSGEAQNALLKTIEEPPAGTVLLLSAVSIQSLLPTIRSRVQSVAVTVPTVEQQTETLQKQGYALEQIVQALTLSGGLPGLVKALLDDQTEHPLHQAVDWSRKLLSATKFERLCLTDELSKQKQLAQDVCVVLARMASTSLRKPGLTVAQIERWKVVLETADATARVLKRNGQPKLALDSLSLHL